MNMPPRSKLLNRHLLDMGMISLDEYHRDVLADERERLPLADVVEYADVGAALKDRGLSDSDYYRIVAGLREMGA